MKEQLLPGDCLTIKDTNETPTLCKWDKVSDMEYNTKCGATWPLLGYTPQDFGYYHCPSCGKKLVT